MCISIFYYLGGKKTNVRTYILITIILLLLTILIHETEHFYFAKRAKIPVHEFSIGFGKCLWSKTYCETKYSIRLIPLGGYYDIDPILQDYQTRTFRNL